MSESNPKGNLFVGAGVTANGTITAPGLIVIDGSVDGVLHASVIDITRNGIVKSETTATNIRVAGQLMNTSTADQSLLIESTGQVSGTISYGDLEIQKGGTIIGTINSTPAKR
jgi:cytoskeletal protein CcmA (bactofilin family)